MNTIELIWFTSITLGALGALGALIFLWRQAIGSREATSSQSESAALEEATVLLADDSMTIQKVVELTFMDQPARVTCVSNGKAATDLLEQHQFDIVLADVHMPGRSGYEVFQYAKGVDSRTPVILLVGSIEAFSEELYHSCGADGILNKPFYSQDLLDTTISLLERRREGRQVERADAV